jgi:hypothetical protein
MEIGFHAQAASTCEKAVDLIPSGPDSREMNVDLRDAYRIWGDALRETGRYTRAAQAYAVAFKAGDDGAASGLVLALTWTARFDAASRVIAAAAARLPSDKHVCLDGPCTVRC